MTIALVVDALEASSLGSIRGIYLCWGSFSTLRPFAVGPMTMLHDSWGFGACCEFCEG